jgi:hypothetical protein
MTSYFLTFWNRADEVTLEALREGQQRGIVILAGGLQDKATHFAIVQASSSQAISSLLSGAETLEIHPILPVVGFKTEDPWPTGEDARYL